MESLSDFEFVSDKCDVDKVSTNVISTSLKVNSTTCTAADVISLWHLHLREQFTKACHTLNPWLKKFPLNIFCVNSFENSILCTCNAFLTTKKSHRAKHENLHNRITLASRISRLPSNTLLVYTRAFHLRTVLRHHLRYTLLWVNTNVETKFSLCLSKHHALKTYLMCGGVAPRILNHCTRWWEDWSASRPGRFTAEERTPDTSCIGGRVGPRSCLDAMTKRKIPIIAPAGNWTAVNQSVA
jgi:hypothetical protein